MRERAIIFSGSSVRSILADLKWATRRIVKPAPVAVDAPPPAIAGGHWEWKGKSLAGQRAEFLAQCPYGQPGDRLWVREAWAADAQLDSIPPRDLSQGEPILYQADGALRQTGCSMVAKGKQRPAIFMPRWASRIVLEITALRVERLQAISTEQALAEGVRRCERHSEAGSWCYVDDVNTCSSNPIHSFELIWKSTNGAGSWDANPWVWVIEFRRVQP